MEKEELSHGRNPNVLWSASLFVQAFIPLTAPEHSDFINYQNQHLTVSPLRFPQPFLQSFPTRSRSINPSGCLAATAHGNEREESLHGLSENLGFFGICVYFWLQNSSPKQYNCFSVLGGGKQYRLFLLLCRVICHGEMGSQDNG